MHNGYIYLDNSAGSWPKPPRVAQAMAEALTAYGANPGRGNYALTRQTAALVEEAREETAEFFGLPDPKRVVFTSGATMSLNMAINGLLSPDDILLLAGMEHNAVSRPAAALADEGKIELREVIADSRGELRAAEIGEQLRRRPRPALLALTHGSNVCGSVAPLTAIALQAKRRRVHLLLDASQTAGLLPVHMRRLAISACAVAGHKALYGPAGVGALLLSAKTDPRPLIFGGTGSRSEEREQPRELPEHLEAGSVNVPGIAGYLAGLRFVKEIGVSTLYAKAMALTEQLRQGAGNIPGVRLYGRPQLPVLSLNIEGKDPGEVAALLDSRYHICVRSGYHCAPAAHRALGTLEAGTVRFSPGWFNTREDIEAALTALSEIAKS